MRALATLTRNLLRGQGPGDHRLAVTAGTWPADLGGFVFVVGPDKRRPGGHWFGAQGLLQRIDLRPDGQGRIAVRHRRVETPVSRLRRRIPFLFKTIEFVELSPLGVTNLANTSVEALDGRLFVGYDAGRPLEVDPESMAVVSPVGANDEWLQSVPGLFEPLCAVAAHPAVDHDERTVYFANYQQVSPPGHAAETHLARWRPGGRVQRWRLEGMSPFDSIHDVKVTDRHVVLCDLPFALEPQTLVGRPRTRRIQQHTSLWFVDKAALDEVDPGGSVPVTEVQIPLPTGHLTVDRTTAGGVVRVFLQHIPLADLMITLRQGDTTVRPDGSPGPAVHPDHDGMVALAVQPTVVGRYLIDLATATVRSCDVACDPERSWGGVLATSDTHHRDARAHQRNLWYAGLGFDPDLVPRTWWELYGEATDAVVAPADLPRAPQPGNLVRFDLEAMEVVDAHHFAPGTFPSPPTFVPRQGATEPDDGYLVVVVHRDGPKAVQVFDAMDLAAGPVAEASAPDFSPNLLLHSCWLPDVTAAGPHVRPVRWWRDLLGALRTAPRALWGLVRTGPAMVRALRRPRARPR